MFKKVVSTLTILSALVFSSVTWATNSVDPYQMIQDVAMVTFDRIKKEQKDIEANPELLREIMEQELLPYVDYKFSAYKVLGKHFKSVPKEKLREFVQVFREYLITTYAVAMGYYDDQTVEFEPSSDFSGKKSVTVRAVVKEQGRPDIKIAFKVRKNKKTNQWKAYDMVAEGISVLSSKQSEFESILRQDGIETVINLMKSKIDQPITLQEQSKETE